MLVRNPYDTNSETINNDEYLNFEDFSEANLERTFPPFFSPNNQPGPPFGNTNFGPGSPENKPPTPGSPSNPNNGPDGSPPSYTPKQTTSTKSSNVNTLKVSPGSLRPCLYQYVYVWQRNGSSYWAWFTRIDRTTASGYRWNGWRWIYFGVDLKRISSFECYGRKDETKPLIDNVISSMKTQKLKPIVCDIEYPFIDNIEIEDVANIINYELINVLEDLIRNQVLVPEKVNFEKVQSSYEVPLDGYGLFSVVMSISTLVKGESRPRITFDSITLDLNTSESYDFDDLFNPKTNYKESISKIVIDIAKKLNYKLVVPYNGITENQKYYLTPIELVLYYQVDEYTPANQGLFRIPIPYKLLTEYLSPESPINKILKPANLITIPEDKPKNSNTMESEYLGTYTGVVPEEDGTSMSPEYMGTYTGNVPKK